MMSKLLLIIILFCSVATFAQQGFFLDDHEDRTAVLPSFTEQAKPATTANVHVTINSGNVITPVSKYVFGNNANVYMTHMVDQPSLIKSITDLKPNVIRFPGGNLSSVYFWNKEVNQPPADAPAQLLDGNGVASDAGYWYGVNTPAWSASLDSYYETLAMTANTGIITVNYGYARYGLATDPVAAAAHLAADWVRYDNGRTKFWEIGNESNGSWQAGYRIKTSDNKDGQPQIITGALYGKHFKVFADSMRHAAEQIGVQIYIGAQLLQEAPASWWNDTDRFWNQGVFQEAANLPDYYIIHSYYTPYNSNSTASEVLATGDKVTKDMMTYVTTSVDAAGLNQKPIALTEWNIFAVGSKQMTSHVSGMHAAIVLGELIKNKYGLACRWDLANGYDSGNDHGMFSQGNEPGIPMWNPRPSFFYMYYFQKYFGDTMVETNVSGSSDVLAYGSTFASGEKAVVIVNKGTSSKTVDVNILNGGVGDRYYYYTLTGGTDNAEFSVKVNVNGVGPALSAGGPAEYETINAKSSQISGGITFEAPARSVTYVLVEKGTNVITGSAEKVRSRLNFSPNPASNKFSIEVPDGTLARVEISDLNGRVVHYQNTKPVERLDVDSNLKSGLYLMRVFANNKVYVEKIVIE